MVPHHLPPQPGDLSVRFTNEYVVNKQKRSGVGAVAGGWGGAWWRWSGGLSIRNRANTLGVQGRRGAAGLANGAAKRQRGTWPTFTRTEAPTRGTFLDLALCTSSTGCSSISFITKGGAVEGRQGSSMAEGS